MKKQCKRIGIALCGVIAVCAFCGQMIYSEWGHAPIHRTGDTYVLRDTYNNHLGTISLADAECIHENESGLYEVWQYEDAAVPALLEALAWRQNDMDTDNESAQFGISVSNAETDYLPQDRAQDTYYFSNYNNRTYDYVHLYFYPEVTLGNGMYMQNALLIMREY